MVVVTVATFNLVQVLFTSLTGTETLSDVAWNMVLCAKSCSLNQVCGGYSWDENQVPRCTLLVWTATGVGNSDIRGKTYRRQHYQGKTLVGSPITGIDIGTIHERCEAMNAVPILPPFANLDKSIFQVRPKPFIILGIKRQLPPSLIYKDYTGKEYDTSDSTAYTWIAGQPSNGNNENFIYMDWNQEVGDADAGYVFAADTCLLCMQK